MGVQRQASQRVGNRREEDHGEAMNPQPIVDLNREGKGRTVDAGGPELGRQGEEHRLIQRPAQRLEAAEDLAVDPWLAPFLHTS